MTAEKRDDDADASLRPQRLAEFIGQEQARANLRVFIEAARARKEALDHVLFVGPPGLGKTTLAQIVARELGVNFRATSGPVIAKAGDLAALLTNLEPRDVLFIDEIHRLNPAVEEILYPAMEDFQLDLIIGEGPAARSVKIDLAPFTLVGATTRAGLLTNPLRDRFGIPVRLEFLFREGARRDRQSRRARARHRHTRRRRQRDRAPRARHAAHRRAACCAACATSRMSTAPRPIDRKVADRALARARGRCAPGSTPWTGAISRPSRENYGGGPVGVDTHGGRAVRAARRHRGHHRAVPDPERLHPAHAARAAAHRPAFRHLGLPEPARDPSQFGLFGQDEDGMNASWAWSRRFFPPHTAIWCGPE